MVLDCAVLVYKSSKCSPSLAYTNTILAVSVVEVDQPPASSVRRFLALLEQSDIDFSEELGEVF